MGKPQNSRIRPSLYVSTFSGFTPSTAIEKMSCQETCSLVDARKYIQADLALCDEAADCMVKQFDKNGDGVLQMSELDAQVVAVKAKIKEMEAAFNKYDVDGSGDISDAEALIVLKEKFPSCEEGPLDTLVKVMPRNDEGKVEMREFVNFLSLATTSKISLSEEFDKLDVDKSGG